MTLDLHGYREDEATATLMSTLFSFDMGNEEEMEIIVGNGQVLSRAVANILEEEGYHWTYNGGNTGSIIVKK